MTEPARLRELAITNLGFTRTQNTAPQNLTGTLMYMSPEVLAGQSPTALADVFALGVLLYQLVAGDFRKPLSPGWEADIADPLIREDIAAAASGDASRRLPTVAALAERLRTLAQRRVKRDELDRAEQRAQSAERRLMAARARRPWILAAGLALAVGLCVSFGLYRRTAHERDRANRETAIASAMNRFLANGLFVGTQRPFSQRRGPGDSRRGRPAGISQD